MPIRKPDLLLMREKLESAKRATAVAAWSAGRAASASKVAVSSSPSRTLPSEMRPSRVAFQEGGAASLSPLPPPAGDLGGEAGTPAGERERERAVRVSPPPSPPGEPDPARGGEPV